MMETIEMNRVFFIVKFSDFTRKIVVQQMEIPVAEMYLFLIQLIFNFFH